MESNMDCYVGLDASLKKTSVCVVDGTGKVLCEGVVDSQPSAIAKFLKSRALGAIRIGIETGPTSIWLTTELRALGLPVICIDARHAKAVLKMQINKSDRNDAPASRASCRLVGSKRCASKASIVMPSARC
jgi:transposase